MSSPENLNLLSSQTFRFSFERLPNVNFFCNTAEIPEISLGQLSIPTPFVTIPKPGDKLSFRPLTLSFRVDEDMRNYKEVYDWMVGLGHPESLEQRINPVTRLQSGKATEVSDASLFIMSSNYRANIEVKFFDIFPVMLGGLTFATDRTDVEYLSCTSVFVYSRYELSIVQK